MIAAQTMGGGGLRLLFVLALIVMAVAMAFHAIEKHGAEAMNVYQCYENNGPSQVWHGGDRYIFVCELEDGRFGLLIESLDGKPITAFIRNKARNIGDVVEYLLRRGAHLIR